MTVSELHEGLGRRLKTALGKLLCCATVLTILPLACCNALAQQTTNLTPGFTQGPIIETDNRIALRDGTVLSANVYRPAGPATSTYPTLYAATPLPLGDDSPDSLAPELGPVSWYVEQGYAVVLVNVRGTGRSTGEYGFLSREEQQDHYEVIDWISSQPWSNQRVAGYGSGYSATAQWHMASQFSRNLQCIAPVDGATDPYSEWVMPGGVRNTAFITAWYETRVRDGNAFRQSGKSALIPYDLLQETRRHPLRDAFWQQRSPLQQFPQINTPVFVVYSWDSLEAGTSLSALEKLQVNWKLLLLPAENADYGDTGFHAGTMLPYYDWCLRGEETSYPGQPAVRFIPENSQDSFDSAAWPPRQVRQTAWNLAHSAGDSPGLITEEPERESREPLSGNTLRYRSARLETPLSLTGPVMLELYFNTTSQDTAVEVTLLEEKQETEINNPGSALPGFRPPGPGQQVQPALFSAGYNRIIGAGVLRASLRASTEGAGIHDPQYSFTSEQLMVPGRPYRLDIALNDTGTVLAAGSRLVLELRLKPDGTLPDNGGHQILYGGTRNPSRLWLPVNEEITPAVIPVPAPAGQPPATSAEPGNAANALFDENSPFIILPRRDTQQGSSETVQ